MRLRGQNCCGVVMQRAATKQSPGASSKERAHIAWIKERGECIACGAAGGVIAHHCVGSTYKLRVGVDRVQIGHAFVLGLCQSCDDIVTHGTHRAFRERFGSYAGNWDRQYADSPVKFDDLIVQGIMQSGR